MKTIFFKIVIQDNTKEKQEEFRSEIFNAITDQGFIVIESKIKKSTKQEEKEFNNFGNVII